MNENHWLLPAEATPEEKEIILVGVQTIYRRFTDPIDHLIIALVFELGYPRQMVALITKRNPKTIWLRIKKIKTVLATTHKSYLKSDLTE